MKKNTLGWILSLLIAFLPVCPAKSQDNGFMTDKQRMGLTGKVKTVHENIFKAVSRGGLIVKGEPVSNVESPDHILFNEQGDLLSEEVKAFAGTNPQDSVVYTYNNTGKCLKEITYYPSGEIKESKTNVYDEKGLLRVTIIRTSADEENIDAISYTYDPYGKLAIKIFNRKNGDMRQERYAYDKTGNWVVRVDFNEYDPVYYVERQIEYFE